MLAGVSVTCFLFSYLTVLAIEASRFAFKMPARNLLLIGMLVAGLIAHTVFLVNEFWGPLVEADRNQLLANWFQWSVLGAWGLAITSLALSLRNPSSSTNLFLMPLILGLIGVGQLLRGAEPFQGEATISAWRIIHGVSLLLGTMFICFGAAFGSMYLLQSIRLKNKRRSTKGLRLPPLEFLQSMNRLSLFTSAITLAIGLVSGIVLNVDRDGALSWLSGGILFTVALSVWSFVAALLELLASGSLGGRRSAYLALANFVFLAIVLSLMFFSSHGQLEDTTGPNMGAMVQQGVIS